MKKINKNELLQKLDELTYNVTQKCATELAFTGKYNDFYKKGEYKCICCELVLFKSSDKYDSKSGWPSFLKPINDKNLCFKKDESFGMKRVEVKCSCGSHLGHVFDDGPKPYGKRFCINSVSLKFEEK